jgi:N6-adenosine-specific RNA methylase IME4
MITPFKCIIADPPWPYRDQMKSMVTTGDGAAGQYRIMTAEAIQHFLEETVTLHMPGDLAPPENSGFGVFETILEDLIADDAHLWLWITNAHLLEGWHIPVLKHWGFEAKTLLTWNKGRIDFNQAIVPHIGQGHYLRNATEHCILAVRGRCPARVRSLSTFFIGPARWPGRLHSEKPSYVYELAERLSPAPYLELFARKRREGWAAVGDEL